METKKVAVITGGMGGLGEAICHKMASQGYRVVATHSPANEKVSSWLAVQKQAGFQISTAMVDVTNYASCANGVRQILGELGRIDILVNNAGITHDAILRKMKPEDWLAVIHTNLDGVFNMTRQVLDGMLECEWGRIINISSVNGQRGAFGQTNYAAAKAGIHGFTKALALEVARKGITVNSVSPGYLRTPMTEKIAPEILKDKILPEIPIGRLGEPNEVAALVAFLCSDDAAFITGANVAINGGQHMC